MNCYVYSVFENKLLIFRCNSSILRSWYCYVCAALKNKIFIHSPFVYILIYYQNHEDLFT